MVIYGDDHVIAVGDNCPVVFNGLVLAELIPLLFGMDYTTAAKEKFVYPYDTLSTITFLKRGYRSEGTMVFAPLDEKTLESIPAWITDSIDYARATTDNVKCALREYMHYGREKFQKAKSEYIGYMNMAELPPHYISEVNWIEYSTLINDFRRGGIPYDSDSWLDASSVSAAIE